MQTRNKSVKIVCIVLAVLMVLTLFSGIFASLAHARNLADIDREINQARGQISDLEGRGEALDSQIAGLGTRLRDLRGQEGSYLEELGVLQEQLAFLEERIALTEEQIEIYEQMIVANEQRLEQAIEREEQQFELYRTRIRTMEERGAISYIQILLGARSFGDLVAKIHDIGEIMAADQRIAEALERYRIAVQAYRDELLADRAELEVLIAQLEADRAELETERAALQRLIDEVTARIRANEVEQATLEAERERIDAQILAHAQDLSALSDARTEAIRLLEQQAAQGGNPGGGGMSSGARPTSGMFAWPSDTETRVSSGFGPRRSPGGIGSTFHQGIDIPARHGTNVLAAASGYVTFSGWSGGFGNFIMIRHGNGYYTAYAHMSANLVSRGQNVVQGQVIGRVGSTGNSTGPHIHFEILTGGRRVDPMLYF